MELKNETKNIDKKINLFSNFSAGKSQRINSAFARYNSIGQLSCIICNQSIKNELLWNKHLVSKMHLENKIKLKNKIDEENCESIESVKDSRANKRNISESLNEKQTNYTSLNKDEKEIKKQKFETMSEIKNDSRTSQFVKPAEVISGFLPEGFYDDRCIDDRVRGVNKTQDLNSQYDEFKRLIQMEESKSELDNSKDEKMRDVGRELEEVDELIFRWEKIESFHNKREELLKNKIEFKKSTNTELDKDSDKDDSDVDLENFLSITLQTKKRC